jgi:acyl carrier protein
MHSEMCRLDEAFRTALELPPEVELERLEYGGHPHWDSVGHMALVAEIEDVYGLTLDPSDVRAMSSYAKTAALLEVAPPR